MVTSPSLQPVQAKNFHGRWWFREPDVFPACLENRLCRRCSKYKPGFPDNCTRNAKSREADVALGIITTIVSCDKFEGGDIQWMPHPGFSAWRCKRCWNISLTSPDGRQAQRNCTCGGRGEHEMVTIVPDGVLYPHKEELLNQKESDNG